MTQLSVQLTPLQEDVIKCVCSGMTIAEMRDSTGKNMTELRMIMNSPLVQDEIQRVRALNFFDIAQRNQKISDTSDLAISRLRGIIEDKEIDPKVVLEAIKEVLDRGGHPKVTKTEHKSLGVKASGNIDELKKLAWGTESIDVTIE